MCGIAGIAGEFVPGLIQRMNQAQGHRGPDGRGVHVDPELKIGLGHVRLAILDLSPAAAQPMISADGRYAIVYNGEIYNFAELRRDLEKNGMVFRSSGDTEVLLKGLIQYGESFISRLNGIFAFAFCDMRERTILLARDPAGVKPLYFVEPKPGVLLFASEIKALFAYPGLKREPNFSALKEHLARGHASGVHTALAGVKRLPPGSSMNWAIQGGFGRINPYWRYVPSEPAENDYERAVSDLHDCIQRAVGRQMVSDVPVGSFLSGGLDSSLITGFARQETKREFRCYTIGCGGEDNVDGTSDDAWYARRLAERWRLPYVEQRLQPELANLLPKLIWHMDEPLVDPAIISCFLICQRAKQDGTPVLLSGQGADELFGGYPRYQVLHSMRLLERCPPAMRSMLASAARDIPGSRKGTLGACLRRIKRVLRTAADTEPVRFLAHASAVDDPTIDSILSADLRGSLGQYDSMQYGRNVISASPFAGDNRYIFRDLTDYLPNHNLLYVDKMGMAVGLETRVPLLDVELLRWVPGLPFNWKVSGSRTKRILRDAALSVVPSEIIRRPKAGFKAPYRKWLRHDLDLMWQELASDTAVKSRGWFDPSALRLTRERAQAGRDDTYMLQWAVLTLELWARQFLDRNPAEAQPGRSSHLPIDITEITEREHATTHATTQVR
jgi:asparagine synthase (glutamine-hydrolysing)